MKLETLPISPPQQPRRRKIGRRGATITVLVLALGAAAGWYALRAKPAPNASAHADEHASAPKVDVYELAGADVATIGVRSLSVGLPLSGSLTPLTSATVKAKVPGVVRETTVQEGMSVAPGQVLARIDQADLHARYVQQQAALDEAEARMALADKNSANNRALLKQNYISQSAYDTTLNSVDLARAGVKSMSAQLELARIALADTVIAAPIRGVVSKRYVQAGEKLAPDMPVYTIVDLSQLILEAQVPTSEIPRVRVGQEVQFKVDGFGQRDFTGKVARINPTAEAGSRAMLVYIAVPNGDGALRGGMFAKGSITTERSAPMPLVPTTALHQENGAQLVYAVENGKVVARPITLGLRNDDEGLAEVTGGLAGGATVLATPLDGVKPGSRVKLAAAAAAANPASPANTAGGAAAPGNPAGPASASTAPPAPAPASASAKKG